MVIFGVKIMPHIKILFFIVILAQCWWSAANASGSMSLQTARSIMYDRNEKLKAAAANVESKQEASNALKWLHGPTISVQGMELYGETRVDIQRSMSLPGGMAIPIDIEENYDFSGPRAAISGTMPIFTGGRIGAVQKTGKYAVDEARARQRNQSVDLDAELICKYFGLQLAFSIERLRKDTLAQENRELERAIKFERQGMISDVERMGVQVARDKAAREHLKAQNDVKTARLELQRLLLHDNISTLSTPLFVLNGEPKDMDQWVTLALENNPLIAIVEARVQQANQGVEAAKSSWFPQIFAFGQYSFIRHYQTMIEPTWLAGLGGSLTLWDAKDRKATYKSARASLREARAEHAEARNQVRTGMETAWLNSLNAREQFSLTCSDVELARENLRLKSRGFGEGLYTALDVTEARNQLLEAEVSRRVAAYQFVVNYAMLHAIAGNMDEFMLAHKKKNAILEK